MLTYARKAGNTSKTLEIWCDNKSVLQVLDITRQSSIVELSNSEGKLVQQTRHLLRHFPRASLNHIKGHQDDDVWYEDLEYQARLNVDCDREAKKTMRASTAPGGQRTPKDGHRATLYIDTWKSPPKCDEQVQYALHAKPMFVYLLERYEWVDTQLSSIN